MRWSLERTRGIPCGIPITGSRGRSRGIKHEQFIIRKKEIQVGFQEQEGGIILEFKGNTQWFRTLWKSNKIFHCPTSLGAIEWANEWAQRTAGAKRVVRCKRISGASERASGQALMSWSQKVLNHSGIGDLVKCLYISCLYKRVCLSIQLSICIHWSSKMEDSLCRMMTSTETTTTKTMAMTR